MNSVKRSLAYTLADSYLSMPLQLIGTMIISRLLTPSEVGVFAVAAVFSALASTFRDFGVAEYLIQEKDLKPEHIRASFTANIATSWLMAIALFLLAPLAADFYRNGGVADVMRVQAVNFLIIPFGAVTSAYFRREMNFRPIFIAGLYSNLTTFAVSIGCAYYGLSYMSLAWASLAGVAVTVLTSLWYRPSGFPRWPGLRGLGAVLHFGKFASGIYIFGQLGKGAPDLVIGRALDLASVAIFSRGAGLVELFHRTVVRAVMPVCLPYFARSNRESGSVLNGYLSSAAHLTVVGWPFLVVMGILAYPAIRIIYGVQWLDAVPLARLLCLAGAIELLHYFSKEALIAAHDVRRSNTLQIGLQGIKLLGLLAVFPLGLTGACYGILIASGVGALLSQYYLARVIGLTNWLLIEAIKPSFGVAAVVALPLMLIVSIFEVGEKNYLTILIFGGVISIVVWGISLRAFRHPLWTEIVSVSRIARARISGRA